MIVGGGFTTFRSAGGGSGQYAAAKHGLRAVADSLRAEVNSDGVRVLSVLLGRTATPMQAALAAQEGRAHRPELLVQPEDVASVVGCALVLPHRRDHRGRHPPDGENVNHAGSG